MLKSTFNVGMVPLQHYKADIVLKLTSFSIMIMAENEQDAKDKIDHFLVQSFDLSDLEGLEYVVELI